MDNVPTAPADFYTGVVAELFQYLRSETPDPDPYARFVERSGQPALELGCGGGDPILDLRERGLDVEGVDSSLDMLDRCRDAAQARGVDVTLHHATFESMDLGRRYRSIYLAGATFNLLPDDEAARHALKRIAAHLHPDGSVLIPLFVPQLPGESDFGRVREHVTPEGVVMRVTTLQVDRNEATRDQTMTLRYEVVDGDERRFVDRPWRLHWFEQEAFAAMVTDSNLVTQRVYDNSGTPSSTHDTAFTFLLQRVPS
jgi:trans-aconitate methyltransferase